MSEFWLHRKTCVVTGASGGIGAGIAATLIKKHGCNVIGVARSEPKIKNFIAELGPSYADQFSYRLFDVSKRENWENFTRELEESGTQVDVLINNAGMLPKFKRFDKYDFDEIESTINVNFYSSVYSVQALLPSLLKSDEGAIINIDSSAALMSLAGTSIYSASKAALKSFTEALREEFRGKLFVGLVCPGFTKTDIFRNQENVNEKDGKIINMISTNCDLMVRLIVNGMERKQELQVHGLDAHAMNIFGKLLPVTGARLFSAIMKAANIGIFSEIFKD